MAMNMTCAQCGQEIVGACVRGELNPETHVFRWSTVPEVIEAHNSLCALVYGVQGGVRK